MRLLHISDLHMKAESDGDQHAVMTALLSDLASVHVDTEVDLVLFSGDLAFSGKPEEFERARRDFLDPLMEILGCDVDRVVIAPGNHDIDRDRIDPIVEAGLSASLDSYESVEKLFDDQERLPMYLSRVESFNNFRDDFYGGSIESLVAGLVASHVVDIDGISVGVCALNTAWRATGGPDDVDKGKLLLGSRQIRAALGPVEDCEMSIAVMHHPLDWLATFDADEARIDLESRFDFLLTGHLHHPDPMQIASTRGSYIRSQTGCVYERHEYLSAYSLIDINSQDGSAIITLRSYWPDRREFDVATHVVANGEFEFPLSLGLGRTTRPAVRSSFSLVRRSLVDVAGETSVLADQVANGLEAKNVGEILVAPRVLPMPYEEWVAASEPGRSSIPHLDVIDVLKDHQCAVLVGGRETGLTSALLWILDRHFDVEPSRLPIHVRFADIGPGTNPLDRAIRQSLNRLMSLARDEVLPPLVVAIDDVDPTRLKHFRRLVGHMMSNPDQKYIIGCRPDKRSQILAALNDSGVDTGSAFLAPFGRRELKSLVEKIAGARDLALVDRVLDVLGRAQMPRTPFLMAALVVVLIEAEDFARGESAGETAVLDSYATLMLHTNVALSRHGLDERNYEHILSCLAEEFVTRGSRCIARLDAELFLVDYFKVKGWRESPGRVLDDLTDRRILAESEEGIRFRHPALQFLFAAKRVREWPAFRELIESDPMEHAVTFQHAAALDRSDVRLLELAAETLEVVLAAVEAVESSLYDQVTFLEGWSTAPDLQAAAEVLGLPAIPDEVVEQQVDDMYDVLEDPADDLGILSSESSESTLERIWKAVELLSHVLRASELVDDVDLKIEMLKRAIDGWGVIAVAMAMEEARTNDARDLVSAILYEIFPDADKKKLRMRAEQATRVLLSLLIGIGALQALGTVKMLDMLKSLLDDESWVASTPHSLFTTFVYFNMNGPDRARYLAQLLKRHGDHPLVRELVRHTALNAYQTTDFGEPDATTLENVLVECTLLDHPREGVRETSRARGLIVTSLQKGRQLSRGRLPSSSPPVDDVTDPELGSE